MNKKLVTTLVVVPVMTVGAGLAFGMEDQTFYGESYNQRIDQVISLVDWNTLSDQAIDAQLVDAQLEPIGDPQDPLYALNIEEINNLSDEEWEEIDAQYLSLYGEDWDDYDVFADLDLIVEEERSWYKEIKSQLDVETQNNIESLLDALEKSQDEEELIGILDALYEETYLVYYDELWEEDYYIDFETEKQEIIDEVETFFQAITSEIDADTREALLKIIDSLDALDDEDEFFEALDMAYELAEDEIDTYFEMEYLVW